MLWPCKTANTLGAGVRGQSGGVGRKGQGIPPRPLARPPACSASWPVTHTSQKGEGRKGGGSVGNRVSAVAPKLVQHLGLRLLLRM